jgi:hypothetical protein
VDKKRFSRNFRYPSAELRDQVCAAVKERVFRSEQAFLLSACEHEIRQGANTEASEQFEARVAATLTNLAKQVQGLQTLAHALVALTDAILSHPEAIHSCSRLNATVVHTTEKSAGQFLNPVGLAKPDSLVWN